MNFYLWGKDVGQSGETTFQDLRDIRDLIEDFLDHISEEHG